MSIGSLFPRLRLNLSDEDPLSLGSLDIKDVLRELEKEETRIVIRVEEARFGKHVTIIQGLPKDEMNKVVKELKHKLATGGTVKDGVIILQGDQRERAKEQLLKMGYVASRLEIQ
ncbi:MAG: hypothetical protein QXR69_01395 [Conexivisphaerales archaeon]